MTDSLCLLPFLREKKCISPANRLPGAGSLSAEAALPAARPRPRTMKAFQIKKHEHPKKISACVRNERTPSCSPLTRKGPLSTSSHDVAPPKPGKGEVLVDVYSAGLNFFDVSVTSLNIEAGRWALTTALWEGLVRFCFEMSRFRFPECDPNGTL